MTGGNYYTWFNEEDAASRKVLYRLENLGITKLKREKLEQKGYFQYQWELTKKGKDLVEKNKNLQELWEEGKVIEFYNSIKDSLEEQ